MALPDRKKPPRNSVAAANKNRGGAAPSTDETGTLAGFGFFVP